MSEEAETMWWKGSSAMLDVDYERGLAQLGELVQRWKPELLSEFSLFEFRLGEILRRQRRYGQSSNTTAVQNEVLDHLIQFTNEHFSLQFIDLCRPGDALDTPALEANAHASSASLSEELWQGTGKDEICLAGEACQVLL